MTHNDFENLVNKFFDGEISKEELRQLGELRKSNHEFEELYLRYESLMNNISTVSTEDEVPANIWNRVEHEMKNSTPQIKKISENYIKYSSASITPNKESFQVKNFNPAWIWVSLTIVFAIFISIIAYKGFNTNMNYDQNTLGMIGFNWKITDLQGNVTINGKPASQVDELSIGDWIETDELSSATINIPDIGNITLEPGTKIRLVQSDDDKKKIELQYGTINSDTRTSTSNLYINADKTTAIDNGSMFSFAVDKNGEGMIFVKDGSVKVKSDKRDAIIPQGQFCFVMTGMGPGTPFNKDASKELRKALMVYDFYNGGAEALSHVYRVAGVHDAVTLVNLLPHASGNDQVAVWNKISNYYSPPGNIKRDSIKYYKVEQLKDWIVEIQNQVKAELEPKLKEMEKNIKNQVSNINFTGMDKEKFKEEMKQLKEEIKVFGNEMKDNAQYYKFTVPNPPKGFNYNYSFVPGENFNFNFEGFDENTFKELNEDLKNLNIELKDLDKDIKKNVTIDLKKAEDELNIEIEKAGDFEKEILIKTRDKLKENREKLDTEIEKNEE